MGDNLNLILTLIISSAVLLRLLLLEAEIRRTVDELEKSLHQKINKLDYFLGSHVAASEDCQNTIKYLLGRAGLVNSNNISAEDAEANDR